LGDTGGFYQEGGCRRCTGSVKPSPVCDEKRANLTEKRESSSPPRRGGTPRLRTRRRGWGPPHDLRILTKVRNAKKVGKGNKKKTKATIKMVSEKGKGTKSSSPRTDQRKTQRLVHSVHGAQRTGGYSGQGNWQKWGPLIYGEEGHRRDKGAGEAKSKRFKNQEKKRKMKIYGACSPDR